MSLILTTKPAREPLSLDEIKDHLRISGNDSDSELIGMIKEARTYIERVTGRSLITQTWTWKSDCFKSEFYVPRSPLQSVSSISYKDSSNVSQTLSASYYIVDTSSEPGRVFQAYGYTYPNTYDDIDAVTITFVSGYGDDPEDVPEGLKRGMKLYIEKMYDMTNGAYGSSLDNALNSIIEHYRIENLAL